ncbi:MAG TPA: NYN domain-containing protein [Gemmatimonadaceae bacterium]|nr:NYN domain-containing protein [Gemmatimonadaceae bacterium]
MPAVSGPIHTHAPNAALLIDFDNVTMGIRSDLQQELRHLLGSEIIKGKVAVQRAYADWRRYPQYIVPLAESSIDMIMAPAYGSSKKNATDIRLAVDAMELVFTRPEIGTYILLSGDSDFASLVTKLKEYGKYVIGVGIRESSSDLLVMNCDEYYSYNALAGLVKAGDEEVVKYDPWELVSEAIKRMSQNGDVMRSDRLKQVMQEIDNSFDEKNLGISKFSRFCLEAAQRGLISVNKLENGQLEVGLPRETVPAISTGEHAAKAPAAAADENGAREPRAENGRREGRDERGRDDRGRRGRRGRGRGRDREERGPRTDTQRTAPASPEVGEAATATPPHGDQLVHPPAAAASPSPAASEPEATGDAIGSSGERLTRQEAFSLVGRAVAALTSGDRAVPASRVRQQAFELLGRDSESLSERNFIRILKDAHIGEVIDLRRRGDDYEVAVTGPVAPVSEQLNRAAAATTPAPKAPAAPAVPRGMGPRGAGSRGRGPIGRTAELPTDLLLLGVVEESLPAAAAPTTITASLDPASHRDDENTQAPVEIIETAAPKRGRGRKKTAAKKAAGKTSRGTTRAAAPEGAAAAPAGKPRRPRAKKTAAATAEG